MKKHTVRGIDQVRIRRFLGAGCVLLFGWGLANGVVSAPLPSSGANLGLSGTITPAMTVTHSNVVYTIIVTIPARMKRTTSCSPTHCLRKSYASGAMPG